MARYYKTIKFKGFYRRSRRKIILRRMLILALIALMVFAGWKLYEPVSQWFGDLEFPSFSFEKVPAEQEQEQEQEEATSQPQQTPVDTPAATPAVKPQQPTKPMEEVVLEVTTPAERTAYLSEETLMDPELFAKAIEEAKTSGMDSIMFDLKDRTGWLIYSIEYKPGFDDYYTGNTIDLEAAVQQIKEAGLKPIASIYAFMDRRFQQAETYAGILYKGTESFWLDNSLDAGGKSWLNPYSPLARDYLSKLISDAAEFGFEEIVLREFRFPLGYSMDMMEFVYDNGQSKSDCLKEADDLFREQAKQLGVDLWIEYPATAIAGDTRPYGADVLELLEDQCVIDVTSLTVDEIPAAVSAVKMRCPTANFAALVSSEEQLSVVKNAGISHYIMIK